MGNRLGRVALDKCLRWDGSGDNAPGTHDSPVPDGHVWQDNHARPDINIILDPNGVFIARSGLRRKVSKMAYDNGAHPDRDVVTHENQSRVRSFNEYRRAD